MKKLWSIDSLKLKKYKSKSNLFAKYDTVYPTFVKNDKSSLLLKYKEENELVFFIKNGINNKEIFKNS